MLYGVYKETRNVTWQCLLDFKVKELPVKIDQIAKQAGIKIIRNSVTEVLQENESGISVIEAKETYIIYNDKESKERNRFTIAHELGHIFMGHTIENKPKYRTFDNKPEEEQSANVFARSILAPACVLHETKTLKAIQIANLCKISLEAAKYREERMIELEKRNKWYLHPLERRVKKQFIEFIDRYKENYLEK